MAVPAGLRLSPQVPLDIYCFNPEQRSRRTRLASKMSGFLAAPVVPQLCEGSPFLWTCTSGTQPRNFPSLVIAGLRPQRRAVLASGRRSNTRTRANPKDSMPAIQDGNPEDYIWRAPVTLRLLNGKQSKEPPAPSAYNSLPDKLFFVVITVGTASLSGWMYPHICDVIRGPLDMSKDMGAYVSQFSNVVCLLFAILVGNTWYVAQSRLDKLLFVVRQELQSLRFLMEETVQEASLPVEGAPPAAAAPLAEWGSAMLAEIELYLQEEVPHPGSEDREPVDGVSTCHAEIMRLAWDYTRTVDATGRPFNIYQSAKQLSEVRNERLAVLENLFPPFHWAILILLAALCDLSFPLLGPQGEDMLEEWMFAGVTTTLVGTGVLMWDLATPLEGVYGIYDLPLLRSTYNTLKQDLLEYQQVLER